MNRRTLGLALAALVPALMGVCYRPVVIVGESMDPTLRDKQIVLTPRHRAPKAVSRGDIVVFRHQGELCVKRVIGVAGDVLRLTRFRNGGSGLLGDGMPTSKMLRLVRERPDLARIENLTVPPGMIFVAGDNRTVSEDSRDYGPVSVDRLVGRVETPGEAMHHALAQVAGLLKVAIGPVRVLTAQMAMQQSASAAGLAV